MELIEASAKADMLIDALFEGVTGKRFDEHTAPGASFMGHVTPERIGTRVGLECACGARCFQFVTIPVAEARWLYKAEGAAPTPIPDAILTAFGGEE